MGKVIVYFKVSNVDTVEDRVKNLELAAKEVLDILPYGSTLESDLWKAEVEDQGVYTTVSVVFDCPYLEGQTVECDPVYEETQIFKIGDTRTSSYYKRRIAKLNQISLSKE